MSTKVILGAGTLASEVFCYLAETYSRNEIVFFSETEDSSLQDVPVTRTLVDAEVIIGVGTPFLQERFAGLAAPVQAFSYVSQHAHIADITNRTKIGKGTIVAPGCILTTDIQIGEFCVVNINTTIGHNTSIGNYCNISPGVHLSGNIKMGHRCNIGTGAVVREKISICDDVVVGMGAAVVKDITEPGVYVGCPAKKVK